MKLSKPRSHPSWHTDLVVNLLGINVCIWGASAVAEATDSIGWAQVFILVVGVFWAATLFALRRLAQRNRQSGG